MILNLVSIVWLVAFMGTVVVWWYYRYARTGKLGVAVKIPKRAATSAARVNNPVGLPVLQTVVIGYREMTIEGGILKGFWRSWQTREFDAVCSCLCKDIHVCLSGGHCECGIYANKSLNNCGTRKAGGVVAQVVMGDTVVPCEAMYIASWARIESLTLLVPYGEENNPYWTAIESSLVDRYQVPVTLKEAGSSWNVQSKQSLTKSEWLPGGSDGRVIQVLSEHLVIEPGSDLSILQSLAQPETAIRPSGSPDQLQRQLSSRYDELNRTLSRLQSTLMSPLLLEHQRPRIQAEYDAAFDEWEKIGQKFNGGFPSDPYFDRGTKHWNSSTGVYRAGPRYPGVWD